MFFIFLPAKPGPSTYAYNVCCKSMYIDGHETLKAFCFLNTTLNETQTSNITNLNKYLIKLEIEEKI